MILTKVAYKKIAIMASFLCCLQTSNAQQQISLSECYMWAEQNYPLIKQKELISKSEQFTLSNLEKGLLPQISINGQSTLQSEVTNFKIPGVNFNPPSKDQYKFYAEINQPLTELYTIKTQKDLQQAQSAVQQQSLSTELYKIHDRINQIYFSILLTDEQTKLNQLNRKDLETGINKVTAAIKNGVDYKSSLDKLKAEMIRNDQRSIELTTQRKMYADMLSYFINKIVDEKTILLQPEIPTLTENIDRPELKTFEAKAKIFNLQEKLIQNKNIPHLSIFMQGGAGQPSPLNFISRDMTPFFIGGLKLNWSFGNLYTQKNDKSLIGLDRKNNELQKDLFIFNTTLQIKQQHNELDKLTQLIQSDNELVDLRNSIKTTSQVQLENGVITSNDYIKEVNAEDQARQNKALHQIQLLISQYNLQFTTGK
jgi:outer membrane protein TolC